jgi:predicted AAA+ superfamily ATPase
VESGTAGDPKRRIEMERRLLFEKLNAHISKKQITLLIGARQVGKTTLLEQLQEEVQLRGQSTHFITLEDPQYLELLNEHPNKLFEIIPPVNDDKKMILFIDEIQYLKDPSNFLKYHYDLHQDMLKMVVTGSSAFYIDEKFKDSLAGRKRIFTLPTLSFTESLHFQNRSELIPFVNSGSLPLVHRSELDRKLNEYLIYGGYPAVILESELDEKQAVLKEISDSYVKKDALEASLKFPDIYMKLLKIIAGQSSLFNSHEAGNDLKIDRMTVEAYLRVMRKSFHVSIVKPFSRNLSKELRKMPKLYLNDLGLRNYFVNNFSPIASREDKGDLLENYAFRLFLDHYPMEEIKFWRTQKKQEVDFIIAEKNAYEIKYDQSGYNPSKYQYFKEKYPGIPLTLVHKNNILELSV